MIRMNFNAVKDALWNRAKTFQHLPIDRFDTPNRPLDGGGRFVIPESGIWVRMVTTYGQSFISGLTNNPCTRRVGLLSFQIFGEKGKGEDDVNTLAEQLVSHFQYYTIDHLEVMEGSMIESEERDTNWYQKNINFTFRVD